MGRLAGLLSSGIGLAMEASSASRSPNRSVSKPSMPSSNRQELSPDDPPPRYEGYPITDRSPSFQQSYDSEKTIQDDQKRLPMSPKYSSHGERSESGYDEDLDNNQYLPQPYSSSRQPRPSQGEYFPSQQYHSPQPSKQQFQGEYLPSEQDYATPTAQPQFRPGLADPVIIPQRRPGDRSRGWTSAYAPSLQDCGIDQETFLHFLESFNEASKSSAALDVVNVAALGVGFAPGIAPMVISMVVPVAVRVAKTKQTESSANSFITRANRKLFAPHGLFAMVMTFKPSDQQLNARRAADISPQLPSSAPLIYFPDRPTPGAQGNQFQQMSHFVADYHDRRAQAKIAQEQPDSAQVLGPAPSFRSRWGDPNNMATNGNSGLRGMITGQESSQKSNRKDRKIAKKEEKKEKKGPGLIGGVRGMITEKAGMQQDQSLIKGIKNMGMQNDLLYLMIVNDPKSKEFRQGSPREDLSYNMADAASR